MSGIDVTISNSDEDDFVNKVVTIRAERKVAPDQRPIIVVWKLPERLSMRSDIMSAVMEELLAEVRDRGSYF